MSRYTTKSSFMKDNSWIRRADDEDEDIDRDPNYGKTILASNTSDETPTSPGTKETTYVRTSSTSVQALSKRFGGSQDEVDNSTLISGRRSSSTNRSSIGDPNSRTTTTTVTKDGSTETTITTTTKTLRSSVTSPTQTFTERVLSSSKSPQYSSYSTTKSQVTETAVTSPKDAEDQLFDTLISSPRDYSPTDSKTVTTTETVSVRSSSDKYAEDKLYDTLIPTLKDNYSPTDRETSVYSTKSVTVKSSTNGGDYKTVTTRTSSSTPEDELYGTLLPTDLKSPISVRTREIVELESSKGLQSSTLLSPSSSRTSISYSSYPDDLSSTTTTRTTSYTINSTPSYEYSGISSPSSYNSSSLYRSRSEELLSDPVYSKSSFRNSIVLEKDLCTHCRKPFNGEAKMILDDMKINCHASCFKCAVCNSTLSHMRAGDSLWVYRRMVHCENCFEITREKWRR